MYTLIVPFNDEDKVFDKESDFEKAKVKAIKIAETEGTCCIVKDYNGKNEKWIAEAYDGFITPI